MGRPIRGWCFVPQGGLATGDITLAQKIALETDEDETMKVALRFWHEVGHGRLATWVVAISGR